MNNLQRTMLAGVHAGRPGLAPIAWGAESGHCEFLASAIFSIAVFWQHSVISGCVIEEFLVTSSILSQVTDCLKKQVHASWGRICESKPTQG